MNRHRPTRTSGRTALITGAAKRLGRACALALARQGFFIVAHYHRSGREAAALARELQRLGAGGAIVCADLASPSDAEAMFDQAVSLAGPIDLLVNSASVYADSDLHDVSQRELLLNLNLHALSPLALSRRLAAQGRQGLIVNFLDARLGRSRSRQAAYHLSKQLLFALTRLMAVEFAPRVRVNAIAPGAILPPPGATVAFLRQLAAANPLQCTGSPADVTRALSYLVDADFVTGQVLFVDGGYHLQGELYA